MFMHYSAPHSRLSQAVGLLALAGFLGVAVPSAAQAPAGARPADGPARPAAPAVDVPPEYVIGPQDVLGINFWRDTDMTGDVTVRPDGRITLPLVGDVQAAGLTPEALKKKIEAVAAPLFKEQPAITVVVRTINSRKVFITGNVTNPGAHVLTGPLTVMQLISLAGGVTEFGKKNKITVIRTEAGGKQIVMPFNYEDVSKGKNIAQNIILQPGDTVVVP
jgi:polysaccharide export outer membrane protein